MRTIFGLAAVAAAALALPAQAQAQDAQPAEPNAPYERADGVRVYPPAFFAEARPSTALDMVSRIPGFSINQNNSVRGFSGAVGNVLFDGSRPASKDEGLSGLLQRIPADQVERIELIRGGASGVDMQGYSTVINVVRRTVPSSRQVAATAGAFIFDDGRYIPSIGLEISGTNGARQYSFALTSSTSINDGVGSGIQRRYDPTGALVFEDQIESQSDGDGLGVRGRWQQPLMGGEIELTGNAGFYDYKFEHNQFGLAGDRFLTDGADTNYGEAGFRYRRPLNARLRGEARLIQRLRQTTGNQRYIGPGLDQLFAYDNASGETIVRGSLTFERSETLTFETGAEGAFNFLDAQQALTIGGAPVPLPSDSVRVEELRGEVFGQATWRIRDNLTFEGGLRLERSTISQSGAFDLEQTFTFLKPRAILTWSPTSNDQFQFRIEREVGQLDFGDFAASAELSNNVVNAGNANLSPQAAWAFEATWERRFWTDGILSAGISHERITDAIDVIPVFSGGQVFSAPGNIGDGTVTEFELEATIPTDRWGIPGGRWLLSAEVTETEVTDPTTGEARGISGYREVEYFTRFSQDIDSWRMNWGFEYQPFGEDTVWRIDQISHFRFRDYASAWIEYKPTDAWSIRSQAWVLGSYDQTRTIYAGPRDTNAVAFADIRSMEPESRVQIRVRRTF